MLNNQMEGRKKEKENKVNVAEIKRIKMGFARGLGDYCHDTSCLCFLLLFYLWVAHL